MPYGATEDEIGLPGELTATFDDGSTASVAVEWVCVSDDNGGTAYDP